MNKNLFLGVGGGALLLIGGLFAWSQAGLAQARGEAGARVTEGEGFLAQAEEKGGAASRDLCVKALRKAEESLSAFPDFVPGLLLLGRAQAALGEPAKACQSFERLFEVEPDHPQAALEAGVAYFERWRLSKQRAHRAEAQRNLERALASAPDSPRALLHLGWMHHEEGETEKRDEIWGRLEKSAPGSAQARRAASLREAGAGSRSGPGGE